MRRWILLLACVAWPVAAMAALDLDPDFGAGGLVTHAATGPSDESIGAVQIDGQNRIVSGYGGYNARGVSRHLANGSLDTAFGDDGHTALGFGVRDVGIQADGRIVAVGANAGPLLEQDWQIARLMPDGSIDTSFGNQGRISLDWYGSSDEARSIALAASGNIIVGGLAHKPGLGTAFALAIFDGQGQLLEWRIDKFFTGTADICNQVLVQPDGKIICAGLARNPSGAVMVVARYEPDLSGDDGFGTDGAVAVTYTEGPAEAQTAMLLPGGEILLGGFVDDSNDYALALVQLTASGVPDTAFGGDGRALTHLAGSDTESINGLFLDGTRILASVQSDSLDDFVVAAFTLAGALDNSFGTSGVTTVDFHGLVDRSRAIASHQGQVLVAGAARGLQRSATDDLALARLTSSGALDTGFGNNGRASHGLSGPVNVWITDAAVRSDGGVLSVGYVGMTFSARDFSLTAFNADGSLDTGFGDGGTQTVDFDNGEDEAFALTLLADGRFLVAGAVRPDGGSLDFGMARFLADGSLDTSFGTSGWAVIDLDGDVDRARDLIVQPDGKILVAGEAKFPSHGYTNDVVVVRFDADGSLDAGFGSNGVARHSINTYDWPSSVALLAGGRIIVGGHSDKKFTLVGFTSNGSLDAGFGTGGVFQVDFAGQQDVLSDLIVLDNWQGQGERIVAVGGARTSSSVTTQDFAAVMLTSAGALEPGFGSGGKVTFDFGGSSDQAASVIQAPGGGLVLAGSANVPGQFAARALTPAGAPDAGFFQSGASFTRNFSATSYDSATAAIAKAGSLTLVGTSYDQNDSGGLQKIALARLAQSTRIFSDRFEQP